MQRFVRFADCLTIACAIVASMLLVAAVFVITWMIFYRAIGHSAYWEIEFSVYSMVAAVFLGSPYCVKTNGHVAVDLLTEFTPRRANRVIGLVLALVSLAVCLYLTFAGGELAYHAWLKGETTESLWRPAKWPLYATMPLGLGITALQYVAEILRERPDREAP